LILVLCLLLGGTALAQTAETEPMRYNGYLFYFVDVAYVMYVYSPGIQHVFGNVYTAPSLEIIYEAVPAGLILYIEPNYLKEISPPPPMIEDVSPDDWFYDHIMRGFQFKLTTGVSANSFRFEPYRNVTRAEFITMLGRLHEYAGASIGASDNAAFYARYLDWAVENDILQGDLSGDLMPYAPITREQMAVCIDRYIAAYNLQGHFDDIFIPTVVFNDWENCSDWSLWSVLTMWNYNLMHGTGSASDFFFRPLDNSSRTEALAVLVRLGDAIYD